MDEHYFTADPSVPFKRVPIECEVWGNRLELNTGSGVFAQGRLDVGTAVLFREMVPPIQGQFLDLGCGYGPIACTLAHRAPRATVWAVDVNERALALAQDNSKRLGLPNIRVAKPDDVDPDVSFDGIWSNPPIRIGKDALHELLRVWLPRLNTADGSQAWLVVQRNLGSDSLAAWMVSEGWIVTRIGSKRGYRILRVTRP